MSRARLRSLAGTVAALTLVSTLHAGTRTHVAFAGRDDSLPKLGRPGVAVRVNGPSTSDAIVLANELSRELARQVHTRPLTQGEEGDYDLEVTFEAPNALGQVHEVPFSAVLTSSGGESLWRVEGRSECDDTPPAAHVFTVIGRNVVSALIHDGWLQPRYDPDDPPPPPPTLRTE